MREIHAFCVKFTHPRSASRPRLAAGLDNQRHPRIGSATDTLLLEIPTLLRAGTARAPFKMLASNSKLSLSPYVIKSSDARLPGPPYNPGVHELIRGKREWASSLTPDQAKEGFKGWHERGYIPHRDEPGLVQMVTFHVVDSFPRALRSEWAALFEIEEDSERRKKLQAYLDKGRGECPLRKTEIAKLVDGALRFHHGIHYELRAWVVMPNHIHVLFKVGSKPMGRVIADWKEYTARESNKILGRRGTFWAKDYWDTYMRNTNHEVRAIHYAESNPVKALLAGKPELWPWSSARFRDNNGRLIL